MVEIKWTNYAIQNLNDIGDYIEQDSYRQAAFVVNYLFDSEFQDKYIRELIRLKYRIVYLVLNERRIDILTVQHSAKLLPDLPTLYNSNELSP